MRDFSHLPIDQTKVLSYVFTFGYFFLVWKSSGETFYTDGTFHQQVAWSVLCMGFNSYFLLNHISRSIKTLQFTPDVIFGYHRFNSKIVNPPEKIGSTSFGSASPPNLANNLEVHVPNFKQYSWQEWLFFIIHFVSCMLLSLFVQNE